MCHGKSYGVDQVDREVPGGKQQECQRRPCADARRSPGTQSARKCRRSPADRPCAIRKRSGDGAARQTTRSQSSNSGRDPEASPPPIVPPRRLDEIARRRERPFEEDQDRQRRQKAGRKRGSQLPRSTRASRGVRATTAKCATINAISNSSAFVLRPCRQSRQARPARANAPLPFRACDLVVQHQQAQSPLRK